MSEFGAWLEYGDLKSSFSVWRWSDFDACIGAAGT